MKIVKLPQQKVESLYTSGLGQGLLAADTCTNTCTTSSTSTDTISPTTTQIL